MPANQIAAFVLYLIVLLALLYYAVIYLCQKRFTSYHEAAVGQTWESLPPRLQALLTGMQRNMGAGMLAVSVSGFFLLAFPFRHGERWASWALLSLLSSIGIPTLYATMYINRRTGANTPILPAAISLGSTATAFVLSLF